MAKYAKNQTRKNHSKDNTSVVGVNIYYNANTTSFTNAFLYNMCNTSLGGNIQIIYN